MYQHLYYLCLIFRRRLRERPFMGVLLSRIWSFFRPEGTKIVLVGLDNAGKSTILYQFVLNEAVQTSPTIGSNVEEFKWRNLHLVMWDLGGQESLRPTWSTYYAGSEFVILVIDSTDRDRLSVSKLELYAILASEDLRKAKILIFANKQDVIGCMSVAEVGHKLNLTSIKDHPWHIQACCALTGEGYVEANFSSLSCIPRSLAVNNACLFVSGWYPASELLLPLNGAAIVLPASFCNFDFATDFFSVDFPLDYLNSYLPLQISLMAFSRLVISLWALCPKQWLAFK